MSMSVSKYRARPSLTNSFGIHDKMGELAGTLLANAAVL